MKTILYTGPDISKHQGNVDIKRIRETSGRIGLRVGYGKNNIDEQFTKNALACVNLNFPVLLYWFSYAFSQPMAEREAQYCIDQAKKYWKCCPITFDFEYDSVSYARKNGVNVTKELATNMAIAFLKKVSNSGYIPVLYANRDYMKNYFDFDAIKKVVPNVYLWFAFYGSNPTLEEQELLDIWQYSSKEAIAGVSGNVDMNRFYTFFDSGLSESANIPKENTTKNINILNFQKACNLDEYTDSNGNPLEEDGIDGPNTQYVRKKILLKAVKVDNTYKVGSTGEVVKWWQTRCNEILGHNQTVDGLYGKTSFNETKTLQKKLGLEVDGVVGYNSIQAVFYN